MLLYKSLARRVISLKKRHFIGSSSKDKATVLRVNIVKRAIEIYNGIVVIIYYSMMDIYSDSEGLEVIEAI